MFVHDFFIVCVCKNQIKNNGALTKLKCTKNKKKNLWCRSRMRVWAAFVCAKIFLKTFLKLLEKELFCQSSVTFLASFNSHLTIRCHKIHRASEGRGIHGLESKSQQQVIS